MRLRLLATPWLLAALVVLAACGRGGSHAPAPSGASAAPPPPSSAAAAAAPASAIAAPVPVPTPAATTLALARSRAAQGAAGGGSPCAGLGGAALDACIDAAARSSASPVAIDEDADREFRAAQARRDQQLMDREEEDARLAADQPGVQGPEQEPGYDPRYDDAVDEPLPDDAPPLDEPPPGQGYYPRR